VAAAQSLGFQGLLYDARKAAQGDLAKAGHVEISWDIMGFLSHHDLRYIIYIYIYNIYIYCVYTVYIYIYRVYSIYIINMYVCIYTYIYIYILCCIYTFYWL
jgi:hypothetical protein